MNDFNIYMEMLQTPLVKAGPIVIFIWENKEGWPVLKVSANIERLYGYKVEDYLSRRLIYAEQIHQDDLNRVFLEVTQASQKDHSSFSHEPYRYRTAEGTYRWVKDDTTIIRNAEHQITHYVGYLTDITEYVDTNALLLQKNRWYKELFELSPLGIALNKMSGEFMEINSALHTMCGYTKEEFVQLSYWDITPIEYEDQESLQLESLAKTGMYGPYKKEYIHKEGYRFPVLLNGVKNIDKEGNEYIWSVVQDITELTKANERIFANELKFRSIFEYANDGILILRDGTFVECNDKAWQMLQCKKSDIIGQSPITLSPEFHEDGTSTVEKVEALTQEVLKGIPQVFDWKHINGRGALQDIEVSLSLVENGENSFILCLWRDISERKQILKNLTQEKQNAEIANESKSRFLANMSHEIRTPMNSILGFVGILSKNEHDAKRLELFDHIKSSGATLLTVINDILDLSKIEKDKLMIEKAPFASKDLFDSVAHVYESHCRDKGIVFSYSLSSTLPSNLLGDIVRIKQVLFNLLNNALKFTNEGEIKLDIAYDRSHSRLTCRVSDSGVGIDGKNLEKIFVAFEQEDVSTTRRFGGTGLGLAISSKLVEMMGGKIEVESVLGKGSSFSFSFEIPEVTQKLRNVDTQTDSALPKLQGPILVVEDNKTNQALLGIYLQMFKVSYEIADDGLQAIERYKKHPYKLILMDENMPNMNGIEATEHIRRLEAQNKRSKTPIVAVTANALSGEKERFIKAGMDDYLSKPYSELDIKQILLKYLQA